MMKPKTLSQVSFIGDFDDLATEGLMKIAKTIKQHIQKNKTLNVNLVVNEKDAFYYHIHSSGFLPAVLFRKKGKQSIYSLYSHINQKPLVCIKNHLEYLFSYRSKNHSLLRGLKMMLCSTLTTFIPVFVKRYFLNKMHKVIVPTQTMKKELGLHNAEVIPFGIDTNKFVRKTRKPRKNNKVVVSYFGHADPLKGISDVIEAFGLLDKIYGEKLELHLYLTKFCERTAKRAAKISKNIKVEGHVDDIIQKYNETDIVVLPYRSRGAAIGIPLVLIEAMACECAIITTKLPFIQEIVGGTAFTVETYTPQQIVNRVSLLLNKDMRKEMGKQARQRVLQQYNQKKMLQGYDNLYKEWLEDQHD